MAHAEAALREFALTYPEAAESHPWGHLAVKVRGKAFLFISTGRTERGLNLSVKLPVSGKMALTFPFASPTGYGLGKSGWITAEFEPGDEVPVDLLEQWIDESFRAIAPKKISAKLEAREDV